MTQALTETLFVTLLYLLGVIFLSVWLPRIALALRITAALPVGGLIWMILFLVAGFVFAELDSKLLVLGAFGLVFVSAAYAWQRRRLDMRQIAILLLGATGLAAAVFAAALLPFDLFHTGDSFLLRDMGKLWLHASYAADPELLLELKEHSAPLPAQHLLAAYGFFQAAIQGVDFQSYVRFYVPLFSLSFILNSGLLFSELWPKHPKNKLLLLCGGVLLMSTYQYLLHSVYLHTNLLAACLLTLAVLTYIVFIKTSRQEYASLSFLYLFGFAFSRPESPFLMLFVLLTFFGIKTIDTVAIRQLTTILFAIGAWNAYICFESVTFGTTGADVLSPEMAALLALVFLIAAAGLRPYLSLSDTFRSRLADIGFWSLGLLCLVAVFALDGTHELILLAQNMFRLEGAWGVNWLLLLVAWVVLPRSRETGAYLFERVLFAVLAFILLAGVAAGRYRLGWSDSGNRMLLQVFLLGIGLLLVRLRPLLFAEQSPQAANRSA